MEFALNFIVNNSTNSLVDETTPLTLVPLLEG